MESFVIVAICFVLILIFASGSSPTPKPPTTKHARCPFCGADSPSLPYVPGKDPEPVLFTCVDCRRYYGDTSKMTPEEKQKVAKSNKDCTRIDNMPERNYVIDTVIAFYKNFRRGGNDFPMITFTEGKVAVQGKQGKRLIATYPNISFIADQHLCLLCYHELKRQLPYYNFEFGDGWVSWEIKK